MKTTKNQNNNRTNNTIKTLQEAIKIITETLQQSDSRLFINNIMCLALKDFERDVIFHAKDNEKRSIAVDVSNVFADFIIDRFAMVGLASPATGDATISECNNLINYINGSSDGTDSLDETEE